jgi:hypothetical protein
MRFFSTPETYSTIHPDLHIEDTKMPIPDSVMDKAGYGSIEDLKSVGISLCEIKSEDPSFWHVTPDNNGNMANRIAMGLVRPKSVVPTSLVVDPVILDSRNCYGIFIDPASNFSRVVDSSLYQISIEPKMLAASISQDSPILDRLTLPHEMRHRWFRAKYLAGEILALHATVSSEKSPESCRESYRDFAGGEEIYITVQDVKRVVNYAMQQGAFNEHIDIQGANKLQIALEICRDFINIFDKIEKDTLSEQPESMSYEIIENYTQISLSDTAFNNEPLLRKVSIPISISTQNDDELGKIAGTLCKHYKDISQGLLVIIKSYEKLMRSAAGVMTDNGYLCADLYAADYSQRVSDLRVKFMESIVEFNRLALKDFES